MHMYPSVFRLQLLLEQHGDKTDTIVTNCETNNIKTVTLTLLSNNVGLQESSRYCTFWYTISQNLFC